ncbi:MAG: hypothetical protein KJT03_19590 [Verrucomicrobiae bacterium]|nr:hypothetical protein [Verrucomicrobiae bacterium]
MRLAVTLAIVIQSSLLASENTFLVSEHDQVDFICRSYELKCEDTWTPNSLDRREYETAIREKLTKEKKETTDQWTLDSLCYIEEHLQKYTIEYAGIIIDKKRLIFCNMHLLGMLDPNREQKNQFTMIFDGGASVVQAIYNPSEKSIQLLTWNGEA